MFIKIFKSNEPALPIGIVIVCLLLWLPAFLGMTHTLSVPSLSMPFYQLLVFWLHDWPYQLQALLAFVLVAAQALYLNYMVNLKEVLHKKSFLPALFYVICMSFFPGFLTLNPVLLSAGFLLLAFAQLLGLYKSNSPLHTAFNAGFFLGIAALFYLPPILDFFLLWFALFLLLPFSWRGFVVGLIGLLIPFFFTAISYLWMDQLPLLMNDLLLGGVSAPLQLNFVFTHSNWFGVVCLCIILLLSLRTLQLHFYKNVIRTRSFQQLVLVFFFMTIAGVFISGKMDVFHLSLFAFPLSIIFSYYILVIKKKWWAETIFWLFIASIVFNFIFPSLGF